MYKKVCPYKVSRPMKATGGGPSSSWCFGSKMSERFSCIINLLKLYFLFVFSIKKKTNKFSPKSGVRGSENFSSALTRCLVWSISWFNSFKQRTNRTFQHPRLLLQSARIAEELGRRQKRLLLTVDDRGEGFHTSGRQIKHTSKSPP